MESLKFGSSLLIQVETLSAEFSAIEGPQKSALWVENMLVRVLGSKWLLLYLISAVRVSSDLWLAYIRSTLRTWSQSYVHKPIPTYAQTWQKLILPCFKHCFFHPNASLGFLQPKGSFKAYLKYKTSSIKEVMLYGNIHLTIYLAN